MLKKLFVTAATAGALVAGSFVASAPTQAAPAAPDQPYPSSVVTVTNAVMKKKKIRKGKHPVVKVKVTSGTHQRVTGKIRVNVEGKIKTVKYNGKPKKIKLAKNFKLGWHKVWVRYIPAKKSIFKPSFDNSAQFKVLKKKKKKHRR